MKAGAAATSSRPDFARLALAVLLLAMAAGQLSDPRGFRDIVGSYALGGTTLAAVVASALILGELAAAAGLVARRRVRQRGGATVALVVTLGWTFLGVQAFARGLALDNCGCFGVHAAQPLRWWVLVEDAEFVALAWWVRVRRTARVPIDSQLRGDRQVTPV